VTGIRVPDMRTRVTDLNWSMLLQFFDATHQAGEILGMQRGGDPAGMGLSNGNFLLEQWNDVAEYSDSVFFKKRV